MIRTLNGLHTQSVININNLIGGDGVNITDSNINVDISKQTSKSTISDTDLFVLEDSSGAILKITGSDLKSELEQSTVVEPLLLTGNSISIKGLNGFTADKILKVNSAGDAIEYSDNIDLTKIENFGTALSLTDPDTLNIGSGGNIAGVGTTTNIDAYNINIGKLVATGGLNANSVGANEITLQATQYYSGNPKIHITAQSASGVVNTGAEVNITSKKNGTGNEVANITMIADTEIIMNSLFKISNTGLPTYNSLKILNENSLVSGTNIGLVNNNGVITINAIDTTYTGGTNITLSGTQFNLDTTLVGNLTWTGSQTYQNTLEVTGPASSLGYINLYSNDNNKISLKTNLDIGSDYDVILPSATGILLTQNSVVGGTNIDIDTSANGVITINGTDFNAGLNLNLVNDRTFNLDTTITEITLSTGTVYNGNTIAVNYGGTGLASYSVGDILYASGTSTLSKLAKGSANTFLMSNGTLPFYSAGYSFQNPISINGMNVSLEGINGFGTNNQIISTNGSDSLQYRTLTAGTNISISNTSSTITINSSENYWERDSNISSFDLKTTNTVDNIALTVPFSTSSSFVSTSSIKSTLGLITGTGEHLKFIDYSNTKPLELKGILNTTTQSTYHMAFKHNSTVNEYPLLKQDINNNLLLHWNNIGDRFTFKSDGDCLMSGIISPTSSNDECYLSFGSTDLISTFHRSEFVRLTIKKNSSYAAGSENGYIELIESVASSSNTTRLYFNNAGTSHIYWDGTNLVATQNTFSGSDQRFKKNQSLANTAELSEAFDNIDIYKYQYEKQYAIDKGADENEYVYGFIAQNVKEQTDNLSSQFSSVGKGQGIYPNEKIGYNGDKLVVDNQITINKTDMNLLLWGKIKEMDAIIKQQQEVIDKLLSATTFANFKKSY